ncbi:hypothetical protein Tco_0997730 [Tanacetum coccineum]
MAQAHALCQFKSLYDTHHALQEREQHPHTQRKLREEHAQCSEGLAVVRAEKDREPFFCGTDLESQLAQKDSALVYAERVSGERLSENEELRTQLVFAQKEKTDAIRKLLPTVTGWGKGLAEERSKEELRKIMMRMNGFDPYSDKKMSAEYERLFSKTYSYVNRISHLSEKPVQYLLKLHPAPPPRDAPKVSSGGIVFATKLVKAAEVARSKDTTSLPDPSSRHASEGSQAPPSKKT